MGAICNDCGKTVEGTEKVVLSWSGGKDSALALYELCESGRYEVFSLLTTLMEYSEEVSLHKVHRTLIEEQSYALGIPLQVVYLPKETTSLEYETRMRGALEKFLKCGIKKIACGDIFLEEFREYRNKNLSKLGMEGLYPLWKKDTKKLSRKFIELGFKAVVTNVDSKVLDGKFIGRLFDYEFLDGLPSGVDPCGENGEFHSFVYDGPLFQRNIKRKGKTTSY